MRRAANTEAGTPAPVSRKLKGRDASTTLPSLERRDLVSFEQQANGPGLATLPSDESLSPERFQRFMNSWRCDAKERLKIGLGRRPSIQLRVRIDEGQILTLPRRVPEPDDGRPDHVPAGIDCPFEASIDSLQRPTKVFLSRLILRRHRGLLEVLHESVELIGIDLEADECTAHTTCSEQVVEHTMRVDVREENVALPRGDVHEEGWWHRPVVSERGTTYLAMHQGE